MSTTREYQTGLENDALANREHGRVAGAVGVLGRWRSRHAVLGHADGSSLPPLTRLANAPGARQLSSGGATARWRPCGRGPVGRLGNRHGMPHPLAGGLTRSFGSARGASTRCRGLECAPFRRRKRKSRRPSPRSSGFARRHQRGRSTSPTSSSTAAGSGTCVILTSSGGSGPLLRAARSCGLTTLTWLPRLCTRSCGGTQRRALTGRWSPLRARWSTANVRA